MVVYLDVSLHMKDHIDAVLDHLHDIMTSVLHRDDRICVHMYNHQLAQAFADQLPISNVAVRELLRWYVRFRKYVTERVEGDISMLLGALADSLASASKMLKDTKVLTRGVYGIRTIVMVVTNTTSIHQVTDTHSTYTASEAIVSRLLSAADVSLLLLLAVNTSATVCRHLTKFWALLHSEHARILQRPAPLEYSIVHHDDQAVAFDAAKNLLRTQRR